MLQKLPVENILSIIFIDNPTFSRYLLYFLRGPLTQTVEYLPFKQRVARSSRARPTNDKFDAILACVPIVYPGPGHPAFQAGQQGVEGVRRKYIGLHI
jgi:hypothetical protein